MVNNSLTLLFMRRALVLTKEGAGHPFRKRFPPPAPLPVRESVTDLAFFGASFISGFIIVMGMIV